MGEEIDLEKSQSSDSFTIKSSNLFHQAAKPHGSHQDSSETSSSSTGVNHAFSSRTDYDKLCLSLLCGLPNEQELALNVCTILSNEGNYMLHLEQTPKLIDLLVAQSGVFPLGDDQLKMLYLENWNNLKGRNMHRFWRSTLDLENKQLVDLLQLDLGAYDPHCKLLNLETEVGAHNVEGQRVLRIALILHNLSFEKNNVLPLVSSRNFMRFMLLSIHSSWGNLKQVAYDTLSNLASAIKISIEKDMYSRVIFRTVVNGILSCDRYMNIRSLDILAQLCSHESNEDVLPSLLEVEVYERMVSFLTVRDIMLLIYTLEALYALSDLGRYACDNIVSVHRSIGALVSLLTLDPAEYGPSGQINMKVVKTLVPADADSETDCTGTVVEETPVSETTAVPTSTTVTTTTAVTNVIEPVDAEGFANNWLKSTYESSPGNSVSRNEIYSDYITTCTKTGRKDIVNANVFAEFVKKAFPMCGVKKCESKGIITFHHDGLQKKGIGSKLIAAVSTPSINISLPKVSTPSTPVSCKTPQKTTFNSILKSQLSSAPKVISTTPVKNPTQILPNQKLQSSPQPQTVQQRAIVSSTPSTAGSSTLIKSLLASKVQQRNLQSQVVPSNVSKMVIYSPGGSGLIGPHTTVVRCIRPGSLHAVNIGTQIRSPLQTCLVSNNGATRIITNASPRFMKNTAVIRHTLQPQMIKQGIVSTSGTRINGLQRDMQVVDDATSTQLTQVVQLNSQPNQQVSQIQQSQMNTQQNQVTTQQTQSLQVHNQQILHNQQIQVNSQQNQQILKSQQSQVNAQQNQQVLHAPQVQAQHTQQNQPLLTQQLIQATNTQQNQVLQTQQIQTNASQNQQLLTQQVIQASNTQQNQVLQTQQTNASQNQQILQNLHNQVNAPPNQQILQNLQNQLNAPQNQQNLQNQLNSPQNQQILQNLQNYLNAPQNQQLLQSIQNQLNAPQNQQVLQNLQSQLNTPQNQQVLQSQLNTSQNQQVVQSQLNTSQNQQVLQNLQSQLNTSQNQQVLQNLQSQLNTSQNQQVLQNLQSQLNTPQNQQVLQNLQSQLNVPQNQHILQNLQSQVNSQQNQQILQNIQSQVSTQQNQQILQNLQSQLNVSQNQVLQNLQNQVNTQQNQHMLQSQQVQLNQQNQQVLQSQVNTTQNQQNLQSQISASQNQQILQPQQVQLSNQQNQQILQTQQIQSTPIQNQVLHSHLVQVNSQQNQQVLQSASCSQPSALPNGDNLQSIKNINTKNDSNINYVPVIQNSELLKLIGAKDLTQSEIPLLVNSKSLHEDKFVKEPSQFSVSYESKKDPLPNIVVEQLEVQSQKTLSSPTSILKSVLSDLDPQIDEIKRQQQQKDILRRAPLLNGLLDKGKLPMQSTVQSNAFLLNGNESTTMEIVSSKETKPTQFVQLNQNSFVIPVSSFNTVMSNPQSNLILMPVSSMNPVISSSQLNTGIPVLSSSQLNSGIPIISSSQLNSGIPVISSSQLNSGISVISSSQLNSGVPVINSPPLNSGVLATSPVNSNTFISSSTSTVQLSVPNPVIPSNTTFLSNGSNLMQLCIGQTTLSGTVEVQSDQQGVVRLHIESPENSNQGSDLSSISDITRTLECASKALLKTNAECNTAASFNDVCETAAPTVVTTTITTTSPSALTRTGQQFFVVTPTINQPQLQIQQPNFKFHILHSIPKVEESVDLVTFPNINISQSNQLQQSSSETSSASTTNLKRPSSDSSTQLNVPAAKKPCMDSKILSDSLRTPTSVPCTVDSVSVSAKTHQDTKSLLLKSSQTDNIEAVSKLTTPKTVIKHAPKSELTNDKGNRTFSGLSSVNNNQTNTASSLAPQKSTVELEFLCEWKNCGLKFQSPSSVFLHASKSHAPLSSNDLVCLWEGCDSIKRRRLSHLTHLQDWHCNESVLQNQALRRKQIAQTGKSFILPPQKPPLHPGYAPDAALLAIKRHALQYINPKELSEEKESVLTKNIRLTSALILRNLVTHSNMARTYLRRFEADIAYLAMSPVESARTLAQCLSQLHTTHD